MLEYMKKILITTGILLLLILVTYHIFKQNKIVFEDSSISEEFAEKTFSQAIFKEEGNSISLLNGFTLQGEEDVVQTVTLSDDAIESAKLVPNIQKFLTDLDVNFDGYTDLGVLVSTGYTGVNDFYDFYIFDEVDNKLIKNKDLVNISNPSTDILARVDRVVISTYRSGPMWYSDLYFYHGGDEDTFRKEIAVEPNPNMEFQYYAYRPAKTIPEIPFKEIFQSIIQDNILDISINDTTYYKDSGWNIIILEKERNKDKNLKINSEVYINDILSFTLITKADWEQMIKNAKEDPFGLGNLELKQQNLYGVMWNYYDFPDAYDGGYIRNYFIEKDGYVLVFGRSNEIIESNSDIEQIKSIQFLEKINF
jgi:hypothetical protein